MYPSTFYDTPFGKDLIRFLSKYGISMTDFNISVMENVETLNYIGRKDSVVLSTQKDINLDIGGVITDEGQYFGVLNGDIEVELEDMAPINKKTKKEFQKMVIEGNYKRKFNFGNKEKS